MTHHPAVRLCSLLFATLLVVTLPGCSKSPEELLTRAQAALEAKDYRQALIDLKAAVAAEPGNPTYRFWLGRTEGALLDGVAAEKDLRKAREAGYEPAGELTIELMRALRSQGRYEDLLVEFPASTPVGDDYQASLLALRGQAQFLLTEFGIAEETLARAAAAGPDNPEVAILTAQVAFVNGDPAGAQAALDAVLTRNPNFYDALVYKARFQAAEGDLEAALASYAKVLERNPYDVGSLSNRAELYLRLQRYPEARRDISQLRRSQPKAVEPKLLEGLLLLGEGKLKDGADMLQQVVAEDPENARALLFLGAAERELGSLILAEEYLVQHLQVNPNGVSGRLLLARVHLGNEAPARAYATLKPLLDLEEPPAQALELAATASFLDGRLDEANSLMRRATASADDERLLAKQAMLSFLENGDPQLAASLLGDALSLSGQPSALHEAAVSIALATGDTARAAAVVRDLEARFPNDIMTLGLAAEVAQAKGDLKTAGDRYEAAFKKDPTNPTVVTSYLGLAKAAGAIDLARSIAQRAVEQGPDRLPLLRERALVELQYGTAASAREALEAAWTASPAQFDVASALQRVYLAQRDTDALINQAEQLTAGTQTDPRFLRLAAVGYAAGDRFNQANQTIKQLQSVLTDRAAAGVEVAKFQARLGFYDDALNTIDKVEKDFPRNAGVLEAKVAVYANSGRRDDAMAFVDTIRERFPQAPMAPLMAGELHRLTGDCRAAASEFRTALSIQPFGEIAYKLYSARRCAGEEESALVAFEDWARAHDEDSLAQLHLSDIYLGSERWAEAIAHLERADALGNLPPSYYNKLAWAYLMQGDERALSTALKALSGDPDNTNILDTVGWIALKRGEIPSARHYIRRAFRAEPQRRDLAYHFAAVLAAEGNNEGAQRMLEQVLRGDEPFPERADAEALFKRLAAGS